MITALKKQIKQSFVCSHACTYTHNKVTRITQCCIIFAYDKFAQILYKIFIYCLKESRLLL